MLNFDDYNKIGDKNSRLKFESKNQTEFLTLKKKTKNKIWAVKIKSETKFAE